jgi:serine/threonine protein kinase
MKTPKESNGWLADFKESRNRQFGILQNLKRDRGLKFFARTIAAAAPAPIADELQLPVLPVDSEASVSKDAQRFSDEANPIERWFGELPCIVNGYLFTEQVGRDENSVRYDAVQVSLDRKVRIRVLLIPTSESVSKAKSVALISHPNIENILDVVKLNSTYFVVSHYEDGSRLSDIFRYPSENVPLDCYMRWVLSIAEAVMEFHRFDILHLSVSPDNIIVREDNEAILTNAYLTKKPSKSAGAITDFGEVKLPFPYRSITSGFGGRGDQTCSDVVALGLVLFQLLTKLSLESFYAGDPLPKESMRLKNLIADQLQYGSHIDPVLKDICRKATLGMMGDFKQFSLSDFHRELRDWLEQCDLDLLSAHERRQVRSPRATLPATQ